MSTPSGRPSPTLRAAGVGLVAVALVLGAVGVLAENQDSPSASADGTTIGSATLPGVTTTVPGSVSVAGPATSGPVTSGPATSNPVPPPAGSASGGPAPSATAGLAPGAPSGPGSSSGTAGVDRGIPVRVLNNSTTTGLASDAAARLTQSGWRDVTVGNYSQGIIPTTTVYYRPGTAEQPAAEQIAAALGARVAQRLPGLGDASPGVVLIVTRDFSG